MREHQEPFPLMGRCDAADGPREKTQRAPSKKKKKNKLKRCSNPSLPYFSFFCDDRDRYEERKKIIFKLSVVNEMKHTHTHTHTHKSEGFLLLLQREKNFSVCVWFVWTSPGESWPAQGGRPMRDQGKNVARALCCWLCWEPTRWLPPRAIQFQLVCTPCTGKCFIISEFRPSNCIQKPTQIW